MRVRYGVEARSWSGRILSITVIGLFVSALVWVWFGIGGQGVDGQLLTWDDSQPGRVAMVIKVRKPADARAVCALRAQDRTRVDVGYALVTVPAGNSEVTFTYQLATLAPAFLAELLGCSLNSPPSVPPAQFPPGVAPPTQPWAEQNHGDAFTAPPE